MKKTLLISFVLMVAVLTSVLAQVTKTVTGKVTSALDGSALPGVNVVVKGTTQGVITDVDGKYSIEVPSVGGTLVFSFVGMNTSEVPVGDKASINIALETDIAQLSEVVVTALGIEREKRSLGYATTQVGGSQLTNSREPNMVQALAGKVAGVQVMGGGGTPGASSKIVIRGNRSFGGNSQPLFVIDGVPMDNSTSSLVAKDEAYNTFLEQVNYSNRAVDINPNDIESMTVLKGPAAAALYGVRGANGAIIITTKKGKLGQKTKVEISSSVDFSKVNRIPDIQTVYGQGVNGVASSNRYSWGAKNSLTGVNPVKNIENFFETGVTSTNDVAISAGNEKNAYRISFGNLSQKGIVPTTTFDRKTFKVSAQSELAKNLISSTNISYINSGGRRAQQGNNLSGIVLSLYRAPNSFDLKNYENPDGTQNNYYGAYDNPYWSLHHNTAKDRVNRIIANNTFTYDPLEWLKVTYRVGTDSYWDSRRNVLEEGANGSAVADGQIIEDLQTYQELYSDFIVSATKNLSEKVVGTLTVGNNLNQRKNTDMYERGRHFSLSQFYNISNATEQYTNYSEVRQRSAAFFYDANISYNNMLFLGTTGRLEYSSTFGSNRRNFFFPSATASFVFTELEPLKNINKILNYGKIRYALASSANVPPPYSAYTAQYSSPSFVDGYTTGLNYPYLGYNGYGHSSTIGNLDLKPEFTVGNEVGLELGFFNDRIKADVTYYNQKTTDIIFELPVSPSTGYSSVIDNAGSLVNKGWEISLSGSPVKTKDFEWNIDVNYTRNRNEILSIKGNDKFELEEGFGDPGAFAIVGYPYGSLYGSSWKRDANGNVVVDADGYPIIGEFKNFGSAYPDFTAGIRNTFTYKGVTLSALIDIRQGGKMWNGTYARMKEFGIAAETVDREHDFVWPGVKEDGSANTTAISAQDYWQYRGYYGATEENIQSTSWVRLRELSLGYSFKNIKYVKGLDITFTGRNLWLKTDYSGIDPEISLTGAGSNYNGVDWFTMPNSKSYNIALRITL